MNIAQKIAELKRQLEELEKQQKQLSLLPDRARYQEKYWTFGYDASDPVFEVQEDQSDFDDAKWDCGFYFQSEEQAMKFYCAFSTMLLMRRQPGISDNGDGYYVTTDLSDAIRLIRVTEKDFPVFPLFADPKDLTYAIEAVGKEHIINTLKFLRGV